MSDDKLRSYQKYDPVEILAYIIMFKTMHGISPTVQEIKDALNVSSKSVVNYHLNALEESGYITRYDSTARSIQVVGEKWSYEPEVKDE